MVLFILLLEFHYFESLKSENDFGKREMLRNKIRSDEVNLRVMTPDHLVSGNAISTRYKRSCAFFVFLFNPALFKSATFLVSFRRQIVFFIRRNASLIVVVIAGPENGENNCLNYGPP